GKSSMTQLLKSCDALALVAGRYCRDWSAGEPGLRAAPCSDGLKYESPICGSRDVRRVPSEGLGNVSAYRHGALVLSPHGRKYQRKRSQARCVLSQTVRELFHDVRKERAFLPGQISNRL